MCFVLKGILFIINANLQQMLGQKQVRRRESLANSLHNSCTCSRTTYLVCILQISVPDIIITTFDYSEFRFTLTNFNKPASVLDDLHNTFTYLRTRVVSLGLTEI